MRRSGGRLPGFGRGGGESLGFTLLEALVAVLLNGFVLHAGWQLVRVHRTAARAVVASASRIGAGSVAHAVLRREIRAGVRGRDLGEPIRDTVGLRVFRGTALPCRGGEPGGLEVVYRGLRGVDPGKDSVLVLDREGGWTAADLLRSGPSSPERSQCPTSVEGSRFRWVLEPEPEHLPLALRVFERGSYHLAGRALRYRRGRGGRQPLTGEVFADTSALEPHPGGGLRIRLHFDPSGVEEDPARSWSATHWPREGR